MDGIVIVNIKRRKSRCSRSSARWHRFAAVYLDQFSICLHVRSFGKVYLCLLVSMRVCAKLCDKIYTIFMSVLGGVFLAQRWVHLLLVFKSKFNKPMILPFKQHVLFVLFSVVVYVQISTVFVQKIFIKLCE